MDDIKLKPGRTPSMKSVRSVKTKLESNAPEEKVLELDEFIVLCSKKFSYPFKINVKKETQTGKTRVDTTNKYFNENSM